VVSGVGAGIGGDFRGIAISGVGLGVGGDIQGITVSGIGIGAAGTLRYLAIAGVGIGATRIEGVAVSGLGIGAQHLRGLMLAGGVVRVERGGTLRGVGASAFTYIKGEQHGLTVGLVNYARYLSGVQIGLINIAKSNPKGRRVLPVVNWGSER
jgi:hypothetical protein